VKINLNYIQNSARSAQ